MRKAANVIVTHQLHTMLENILRLLSIPHFCLSPSPLTFTLYSSCILNSVCLCLNEKKSLPLTTTPPPPSIPLFFSIVIPVSECVVIRVEAVYGSVCQLPMQCASRLPFMWIMFIFSFSVRIAFLIESSSPLTSTECVQLSWNVTCR